MTLAPSDMEYEVVLVKNDGLANSIGATFSTWNGHVVVDNVDRNLIVQSIFPERIQALRRGDTLLSINFCELSSVDTNNALLMLENELNKQTETLVKFKLRRSDYPTQNQNAPTPYGQSSFIFHFNALSGEPIQLEVTNRDNIEMVVRKFVTAHNLPLGVVAPLINQISKEINVRESTKDVEDSDFAVDETFHMNELRYQSLRETTLSQKDRPTSSNSFDERGFHNTRASRSPLRNSMRRASSKSPLKNQHVYDEMHEQAKRIRDRKEQLKLVVEKEREEKIKESSFRFQQSKSPQKKWMSQPFLNSSREAVEQIYYDHMLWLESKERNLERLRCELKQKEDEEIAKEMRDFPILHTSPAMQRCKSPSKAQLHHSMFQWDEHYQNRKEDLIVREMKRLDSEAYFIPKINRRSEQLARRRLQRLKTSSSSSPMKSPNNNTPRNHHQSSFQDLLHFETTSQIYQQPYSPGEYTFLPNTPALESAIDETETAKMYIDTEHLDPTSAQHLPPTNDGAMEGQGDMVVDEMVIHELREAKVRPLFSPTSTTTGKHKFTFEEKVPADWIQTLCEQKKELLQQKLPGIVGANDNGSIASSAKPFDKKTRSVSPLTSCCTHYSDSVSTPTRIHRKFSYDLSQTPSISTIAQSVSPLHHNSSRNHRIKLDFQSFAVDTEEEPFDVFSRLYKQREDHESLVQSLKEKHIPQFPHSPNIGSNHFHATETKKSEFFDRLYEHHKKQKDELSTVQAMQRQEILNMSNKLMEKSVLSLEENELLVQRLYWKQQKTEEFRKSYKEKIASTMRSRSATRFIEHNSNKLANKQLQTALGEIFDVLKLSEEFELEKQQQQQQSQQSHAKRSQHDNSMATMNSTNEESRNSSNLEKKDIPLNLRDTDLLNLWEFEEKKDNIEEASQGIDHQSISHTDSMETDSLLRQIHPTTDFVSVTAPPNTFITSTTTNPLSKEALTIALANTSLLQPQVLAHSIHMVLQSFVAKKVETITKQQFIKQAMQMMFQGQLTPIAYLLTSHKDHTFRQKVKTSEEMEIEKHCSHHPKLKAGKITTNMTEQRYSDRNSGQVKIEDSLLSYIPILEQRKETIRSQVEEDILAECTFRPFLVATHLKPRSRRSNSAPATSRRISTENFVDNSLDNLLEKPVEAWYEI